jgi:uncharacterized protein (DUF1810 family)
MVSKMFFWLRVRTSRIDGSDQMDTPPDLQRFVLAQEPVYSSALAELQAGSKRTHWMWFIFPQIAGLGHSAMAQRYAIESASEALAYLQHPVLGPRLRTCTQAVLDVEGRSADQIFGSPDNMKFRSSMTLFAHVAPDEPMFAAALAKYFAGEPDDRTLKLLAAR